MASAVAIRTEHFWRTQRYPISSSLSSGAHVRCFSAAKPPKDGDDAEKKKAEKNLEKNLRGLRIGPPPRAPSWGNQINNPRFQRRPRFGPKAQKFFQAATSPHKKYGIVRSLKLIKDSSNIPILIPGRTLKNDDTEERTTTIHIRDGDPGGNKPQQLRRRRKLPLLNASALLDKATYCRRSAFPGGIVTKSGTEAAKRLLRGKKDLVDMIRGNIIYQQSQRPFCLTGHGIPKQLLQDHINMADSILKNFNEPAECQLISNLDDGNSTTDPSCPDSMTIRSRDGQSRIWTWPPQRLLQKTGREEDNDYVLHDISQSWDYSLVLYLAAMDRLSKELGPVGSYPLNKESRKNWTVKMYRGMAYPIELISRPDDEEDGRPVPILEWSPSNSVNNKKPHVSIRLQGTPNSDITDDEMSLPNPVTLVYDAIFQEDPRVEPARATPS